MTEKEKQIPRRSCASLINLQFCAIFMTVTIQDGLTKYP